MALPLAPDFHRFLSTENRDMPYEGFPLFFVRHAAGRPGVTRKTRIAHTWR